MHVTAGAAYYRSEWYVFEARLVCDELCVVSGVRRWRRCMLCGLGSCSLCVRPEESVAGMWPRTAASPALSCALVCVCGVARLATRGRGALHRIDDKMCRV